MYDTKSYFAVESFIKNNLEISERNSILATMLYVWNSKVFIMELKFAVFSPVTLNDIL